MFKRFLVAVALLISLAVGVLLFTASQKPDTFVIERSQTIDAPSEVVFAQLNDFQRWSAWSPWEKLDANMKRRFEGPAQGTGAVYTWDSESKAGQGHMEIKESVPAKKLLIALHFVRPFEAHNTAEFFLEPVSSSAGEATHVIWRMSGPSPMASKIMQTFISLDSMLGAYFEQGLHNLKAVSEKAAKPG